MKVGIILPVRNQEPYLTECLDSLVAQDYHNVRIYAVNDASTDHTGEILDRYPLDFVSLESNAGVAIAANKAADMAFSDHCDAVFYMSGDDVMEPWCISEAVAAYRPGIGFVTVSMSYIDGSTHIVNPSITFEEQLIRNQVVGFMLIPKHIWYEFGGYALDYLPVCKASWEDYDLATRILSKYPYSTTNRSCVRYRVHTGQATNEAIARDTALRNIFNAKFNGYLHQ